MSSFSRLSSWASVALLLLGAATASGEDVFVLSSVARMRVGPSTSAAVAGSLPIGASVSTQPEHACQGDPPAANGWYCGIPDIAYGEDAWTGWIAADTVGLERPNIGQLLANYDKIPAENLAERRKWAERAAALDPLSPEAQKRLIEVLAAMKDAKALEAAKRSFAAYQGDGKPTATGDKRIIFAFTHDESNIYGKISPIAMLKDGHLTYLPSSNPPAPYDHEARGVFLNVYRSGRAVGRAVTESQHDSRVMWGGSPLARFLPGNQVMPPPQFAVATNFELKGRPAEPASPTEQQKEMLVAMAKKWTESSNMPEEEKARFLRDAHVAMDSGALSPDGRRFLIGTWTVGSPGDAHYNNVFSASLFLLVEQQADGSFVAGSLENSGCSYADHADFDSDGTDELVLACEPVEGPTSYTIFQRENGKWGFPEFL